jgi:hypothetical protein
MACRRRVGASRWNFVALLPFAYSMSFIDDIPLPWFAAMIFGEIALYGVLKVWFVPLERAMTRPMPLDDGSAGSLDDQGLR